MAVWVLHLPEDRLPSREDIAGGVEGKLHLPFDDWPDATEARSPAELRQKLKALHPESTPETIARMTERLWLFARGIHAEDILAIPVASRSEAVFAQALSGPAYEDGRYVLPVRWFATAARLAWFGKHKRVFEPLGVALKEVQSPQARAAIRDRLQLPGNRFRRFKWLIILLTGIQLFRMVLRVWHNETGF